MSRSDLGRGLVTRTGAVGGRGQIHPQDGDAERPAESKQGHQPEHDAHARADLLSLRNFHHPCEHVRADDHAENADHQADCGNHGETSDAGLPSSIVGDKAVARF